MAILVFNDRCIRPHENPFFFSKQKTQNLNLTLLMYVILFSRHVNNPSLFCANQLRFRHIIATKHS